MLFPGLGWFGRQASDAGVPDAVRRALTSRRRNGASGSERRVATEFEAATHGQWNSNISNYSLFEAAHAALTAVSDPHDKKEVADAIHKVNIQALAGPLNFASGGPAPGVAITRPVGVQWQKGTKYPLEMQVVDNTLQPQAKITADLKPTNP
jgi:branched-chain amino acid transport system substrate-binding protein